MLLAKNNQRSKTMASWAIDAEKLVKKFPRRAAADAGVNSNQGVKENGPQKTEQ